MTDKNDFLQYEQDNNNGGNGFNNGGNGDNGLISIKIYILNISHKHINI